MDNNEGLKPLIRYNFANSKTLHADVYKNVISDLLSQYPGYKPEELTSKALRIANAAIDTLYQEGMVFREGER